MAIQYSRDTHTTYAHVCVCRINKKYFSLALATWWGTLVAVILVAVAAAAAILRLPLPERRKQSCRGWGGKGIVLVALCDKLPAAASSAAAPWPQSLCRGRASGLALLCFALCCFAVAACCYFSTNWLFYWITQAAGSLQSPLALPYLPWQALACNVTEPWTHSPLSELILA